jgi:hypothetical protein
MWEKIRHLIGASIAQFYHSLDLVFVDADVFVLNI